MWNSLWLIKGYNTRSQRVTPYFLFFHQIGFDIVYYVHYSIQMCVIRKHLEKLFSRPWQPGWLIHCSNILFLSALTDTWCKLGENSGNTYISVAMNPVSSERKRKSMKTQQQIETVGRESEVRNTRLRIRGFGLAINSNNRFTENITNSTWFRMSVKLSLFKNGFECNFFFFF